MKKRGGPRGFIDTHLSHEGTTTVTFSKLFGAVTGEVTLTTVWAALRSRLVCCAGAQRAQQSELHVLLIEVVCLGLNPA